MKIEYLVMLSEIIDKMGIANELKSLEINTGNTEKDNEELGKQVIMMIFTKIHKCKKEFYSFIATYKGYLKDEDDYESESEYETARKEAIKQAKNEDVIAILKEISKLPGVADFFSYCVGLGTAEVLRILYKHYGGIEKFKKSSFLLSQCLDNGVKKEAELPKLINEIVKKLSGSSSFIPQFDPPAKKMRSAEEILKDYGLGGVKRG